MNREKVLIGNDEISSWDRFKLRWDSESYFEWIKYSIRVLNELHGIEHKQFKPISEYRQVHIDDLVERFSFKRGFFITIHVPSYLTNGHTTERGSIVFKDSQSYFDQISLVIKSFRRRLERKVYKVPHSKKGKNIKHRLGMVSVIEGVHTESKKNHIHLVVETPQHLSMEQFELFIRQSHGGIIVNEKITKCIKKKNFIEEMSNNLSMRKDFRLGKIHIEKLDDERSRRILYTYLTKEVKEGRDTVDWKNSYHKYEWSKSLTIKQEKNKRRTWIHGSRKELNWLKYRPNINPLEYYMNEEVDWIGQSTSSVSRSKILVNRQTHVESNLFRKSSQK
tara:strand:- start:605 stop:1609 length:1005 start_codon:yes stop_codon:yes gene_type:complete